MIVGPDGKPHPAAKQKAKAPKSAADCHSLILALVKKHPRLKFEIETGAILTMIGHVNLALTHPQIPEQGKAIPRACVELFANQFEELQPGIGDVVRTLMVPLERPAAPSEVPTHLKLAEVPDADQP